MQNNLLTVKEYNSLTEKGILTKYDRIKLLNGTIIREDIQKSEALLFH